MPVLRVYLALSLLLMLDGQVAQCYVPRYMERHTRMRAEFWNVSYLRISNMPVILFGLGAYRDQG